MQKHEPPAMQLSAPDPLALLKQMDFAIAEVRARGDKKAVRKLEAQKKQINFVMFRKGMTVFIGDKLFKLKHVDINNQDLVLSYVGHHVPKHSQDKPAPEPESHHTLGTCLKCSSPLQADFAIELPFTTDMGKTIKKTYCPKCEPDRYFANTPATPADPEPTDQADVDHAEKCKNCDGTGFAHYDCDECLGREWADDVCHICNDDGSIESVCNQCDGTGKQHQLKGR